MLPMHFMEIETPAVVIDLAVMEQNIARTQLFFDAHGLALRPHIKSHKIPEFARLQMAAGAVGICAQKLSEAEIMVEQAGTTDIFIPYNIIGRHKIERLAALLARPGLTLAVGADNYAAAKTAQVAAQQGGRPVRLLIECDTGYGRAGVTTPDAAAELAEWIVRNCDMVEFAGLFTFPTHLTNTPAFFGETSRLLAAKGIGVKIFSGGGTPIQWQVGGLPYINEHRTSTYIFNDRNTIGAGAATVDECALRVVCSVVSRPTDARAIIDGGSKAFSGDLWITGGAARQSYGYVVEYPDAVFYACSEEHGNLDFSACAQRPQVGDIISIIPNHCCTTMNMHNTVFGARGNAITDTFVVAARGALW